MTSEIMNINELIHKTFSSISVGESKKAMGECPFKNPGHKS